MERFGEFLRLPAAEPLDVLLTDPAFQADADRPVGDRVRKVADRREHLGAEHRERLERGHARAAHPPRDRSTPVAGIQKPAQVLPVARLRPEDRVDLVEEQSRLQICDRAEQGRVGDVRGGERLPDEELENLEKPGLAAPLFSGRHGQIRGGLDGFR